MCLNAFLIKILRLNTVFPKMTFIIKQLENNFQ
jgi:hypothetical protein